MARSSHTDPDSWGHEGFPEQGPVHMDRVWWASVNGGMDMLGGVCTWLCVHGDRLLHGLCRQLRLGEAVASVYTCIARVWRVTLDHVSMECVSVCMGEQV